ncbi:MAG: glycine/D-amino acid oxidase-like deaminating enzyme [Sphingobacteriales bacterium]|jgi:glycine/D-amino acid oxidase-like deaminating enzyme
MLSYWEKESFLKPHDVIIVGSGLVGLSAAYFLKKQQPKLSITVLERGIFPSGASTKNAGFACFGSVSELYSNVQCHGPQAMVALVEKRWKGLNTLKSLGLNLDMKPFGGHEIFRESDSESYENCLNFLPELNTLLSDVIGSKNIFKPADENIGNFGFGNISHLIENVYETQIDTGKMMRSLWEKCQKEGVNIITGVNVEKIIEDEKVGVKTSVGTFTANKCLVATNGFTKSILPDLDVTPGRGQVLITKPIQNLKVKGTFHYESGFYYFRNIGERILLGGGRNLDIATETTTQMETTALIQSALEKILKEVVLPNQEVEIDYRWSGIMAFGQEMEPLIQSMGKGVFCAVRGSGMGVALGSQIGKDAADLIISHS